MKVKRPALGACMSVRFAFENGAREGAVLEEASESERRGTGCAALAPYDQNRTRETSTANDSDFGGAHG